VRDTPIEAIHGNAADDRILNAANLREARLLLVAIPNAFEAGQIVQQARAANPGLEIVARAHFDAEVRPPAAARRRHRDHGRAGDRPLDAAARRRTSSGAGGLLINSTPDLFLRARNRVKPDSVQIYSPRDIS